MKEELLAAELDTLERHMSSEAQQHQHRSMMSGEDIEAFLDGTMVCQGEGYCDMDIYKSAQTGALEHDNDDDETIVANHQSTKPEDWYGEIEDNSLRLNTKWTDQEIEQLLDLKLVLQWSDETITAYFPNRTKKAIGRKFEKLKLLRGNTDERFQLAESRRQQINEKRKVAKHTKVARRQEKRKNKKNNVRLSLNERLESSDNASKGTHYNGERPFTGQIIEYDPNAHFSIPLSETRGRQLHDCEAYAIYMQRQKIQQQQEQGQEANSS